MGNFKAGCDIFLTVCLLQERFLNRKISFLVYGNWEELQCVTLERQAHVKQPSFTQVQQHKHEKQHQTLSFSCQSGSARAMWSVFWICLNMSWPCVGRTYLTLCSTSKTQGCFFLFCWNTVNLCESQVQWVAQPSTGVTSVSAGAYEMDGLSVCWWLLQRSVWPCEGGSVFVLLCIKSTLKELQGSLSVPDSQTQTSAALRRRLSQSATAAAVSGISVCVLAACCEEIKNLICSLCSCGSGRNCGSFCDLYLPFHSSN